MEKAIQITLQGQVFILEEDAYHALEAYLKAIKAHYGEGAEAAEIVRDIETSMAEKFTEKLGGNRKAVTAADVAAIIAVLGTVDEIASSADGEASVSGAPASGGQTASGEPAKDDGPAAKKRLFRDPDDTVIAGVASGVAAYFGVDPVFIRILFVVGAFLNGTGILAYLILWLAVPMAKTQAQKLEMRGKRVNLSEIQQAVKEKSALIGSEGKAAVERIRENRAWHKILDFPIRIIERIFGVFKAIVKAFVPVLAFLIGLGLILGTLGAMLGLTVALTVGLFQVGSPYVVSDLPLSELAGNNWYYLGAVAVFFVAFIPLIFLFQLGLTALRRKSAYSAVVSAVLILVWFASVAGATAAAGSLVPLVRERVNEAAKTDTVTRSFDQAGFTKLYLGDRLDVRVVPGETFGIQLTGRSADLDRLRITEEDGQLQITVDGSERNGKFCFFCFDRGITGQITMPTLDSFVGIGQSRTELGDFRTLEYISLGEMARAQYTLNGQGLETKLSGVGSELKLSGTTTALSATIDGMAKLDARDLLTGKVELTISSIARADLSGTADSLTARIEDTGQLHAYDLIAQSADIRAQDLARAQVTVRQKLVARAKDSASIRFDGNPPDIDRQALDISKVEARSGWDDEDDGVSRNREYGQDTLAIATDGERYAPYMSSRRGIGLSLVTDGWREGDQTAWPANARYVWKTDRGYFVTDWQAPEWLRAVTTEKAESKIEWTFPPDEARFEPVPLGPVSITVEEFLPGLAAPTRSATLNLMIEEGGMAVVME